MPGAFACMGYALITPGVIIILVGNCLFTRKKPLEENLIEMHQTKKKWKFKSKSSLQIQDEK